MQELFAANLKQHKEQLIAVQKSEIGKTCGLILMQKNQWQQLCIYKSQQ